MSLPAGIYRIRNHFAPALIDLNGGNPDDNTPITAWRDSRGLTQAWFIQPYGTNPDTYTVRNVTGGSYMDLQGGSTQSGTPIVVLHQSFAFTQAWVIRKSSDSWYKLQNVAAQTFLDLDNGGAADGTKITASAGDWNSPGHQGWDLTRISLSASEVHALLKANPSLQQDFASYLGDSSYLALSQDTLDEIWQSTGLGSGEWKNQIWDGDDYAILFKTAVSAWANKNIQAEGFAILFGVMYGQNQAKENYAYNWYAIEGDQNSITFHDPRSGQKSNEPWGNKAYFGFF